MELIPVLTFTQQFKDIPAVSRDDKGCGGGGCRSNIGAMGSDLNELIGREGTSSEAQEERADQEK